jgi:hypothetical protein
LRSFEAGEVAAERLGHHHEQLLELAQVVPDGACPEDQQGRCKHEEHDRQQHDRQAHGAAPGDHREVAPDDRDDAGRVHATVCPSGERPWRAK